MTLHIIKSAKADIIVQVSELASESDQVMLIEDGCYLYTVATKSLTAINTPILALSEHMQARGLSAKASAEGIELITFKQWALLTHHHPQSTSW
ncbi:MAG: sulfurtransferase complex subunit TusB [Oleispira sp.]|nr:sulfurtransferase complex subunit TusB [Oleispira sp.]